MDIPHLSRRVEDHQHIHRVAGSILGRIIVASLLLALALEVWAGAELDRLRHADRPAAEATARPMSRTVDMGAHRVPVRLIDHGQPGDLILVDPVDDGSGR